MSYENCPHIQVGGNGAKLVVVSCTACDANADEVLRRWIAGQPWYVRLDEWQHRHLPPVGQALWHWAWLPLCNFVDRTYR